jgi:uncharacterized C2H2 Zn-finger protein|nr:MAG TPA: hypothetical protein [Caudoviricetes sp.]
MECGDLFRNQKDLNLRCNKPLHHNFIHKAQMSIYKNLMKQ